MKLDGGKHMVLMAESRGDLLPSATIAMDDFFECIPDSLLLQIFNKVADVKVLGACRSVSKRFLDVVSKVDNVLVRVDCVISGDEGSYHVKGQAGLNVFLRFLLGSFTKPFQALYQVFCRKKVERIERLDNSPREVLKNLKCLHHLRIELPIGELNFEDGTLLKWKAEFGSTLESCVILGASSVRNNERPKASNKVKSGSKLQQNRSQPGSEENGQTTRILEPEALCSMDENASLPESFYNNGGLKLRVVWTISSLIAASARHYLLQQIISDHPTLESLVVADAAAGQGTLCMSKEQLQDARDKPIVPSESSNRTQIPALSMKLWYAPHLELPGGTSLEGATLVAILPSDRPFSESSEDLVAGAFKEPFMTATRILAKRRTYILEMNSF